MKKLADALIEHNMPINNVTFRVLFDIDIDIDNDTKQKEYLIKRLLADNPFKINGIHFYNSTQYFSAECIENGYSVNRNTSFRIISDYPELFVEAVRRKFSLLDRENVKDAFHTFRVDCRGINDETNAKEIAQICFSNNLMSNDEIPLYLRNNPFIVLAGIRNGVFSMEDAERIAYDYDVLKMCPELRRIEEDSGITKEEEDSFMQTRLADGILFDGVR